MEQQDTFSLQWQLCTPTPTAPTALWADFFIKHLPDITPYFPASSDNSTNETISHQTISSFQSLDQYFQYFPKSDYASVRSPMFYHIPSKTVWEMHWFPNGALQSESNKGGLWVKLVTLTLPIKSINATFEFKCLQSQNKVSYTNNVLINSWHGFPNLITNEKLLGTSNITFVANITINSVIPSHGLSRF